MSQSAKDHEKARKARLAAALRANLHKRKDQARLRASSEADETNDTPETGDQAALLSPQTPSSQD